VLWSTFLVDEVLRQALPVLPHGADVGHLKLVEQFVGQVQRSVVPELIKLFSTCSVSYTYPDKQPCLDPKFSNNK
jgi:hypothetical protein